MSDVQAYYTSRTKQIQPLNQRILFICHKTLLFATIPTSFTCVYKSLTKTISLVSYAIIPAGRGLWSCWGNYGMTAEIPGKVG